MVAHVPNVEDEMAFKEILFSGAKTYTLYCASGIGQVLTLSGQTTLKGRLLLSPTAEQRIVTNVGNLIVAKILNGDAGGLFVDIDEHNLRCQYPGAPEQPVQVFLL